MNQLTISIDLTEDSKLPRRMSFGPTTTLNTQKKEESVELNTRM